MIQEAEKLFQDVGEAVKTLVAFEYCKNSHGQREKESSIAFAICRLRAAIVAGLGIIKLWLYYTKQTEEGGPSCHTGKAIACMLPLLPSLADVPLYYCFMHLREQHLG